MERVIMSEQMKACLAPCRDQGVWKTALKRDIRRAQSCRARDVWANLAFGLFWDLSFISCLPHFPRSHSILTLPQPFQTAGLHLLQRLTLPQIAPFVGDRPETYPCPIFSKRVYFFLGSPTLTILPESERKHTYNDCACCLRIHTETKKSGLIKNRGNLKKKTMFWSKSNHFKFEF